MSERTGRATVQWATYGAVTGAVVLVGLALGVSLPLVSLRLDGWGHGAFAIGVMAAMPAVGVLLGARLSHRLAGWCGTPRSLQLSHPCRVGQPGRAAARRVSRGRLGA